MVSVALSLHMCPNQTLCPSWVDIDGMLTKIDGTSAKRLQVVARSQRLPPWAGVAVICVEGEIQSPLHHNQHSQKFPTVQTMLLTAVTAPEVAPLVVVALAVVLMAVPVQLVVQAVLAAVMMGKLQLVVAVVVASSEFVVMVKRSPPFSLCSLGPTRRHRGCSPPACRSEVVPGVAE